MSEKWNGSSQGLFNKLIHKNLYFSDYTTLLITSAYRKHVTNAGCKICVTLLDKHELWKKKMSYSLQNKEFSINYNP